QILGGYIVDDQVETEEWLHDLYCDGCEPSEAVTEVQCQLGMLRSTCRAAAASCNFPGTYSVIGRKVTEKSCTESFFDRFSVLNAN
ncbi:hypothetical protein SB719_21245, partial [Pantoea sp. SIMBA_079]|uniref:hypothetical protein n=1 Tax=Pantoea sp. SIMBA_079 TaxID=3085817 RepID=UPI0039966665